MRAAGHGGVFDTPMRLVRMPGPDRADFARGVVADSENEIHLRRAGRIELVPAFRAHAGSRIAVAFQRFERKRIDRALRHAAGGVRAEATRAVFRENALGHDRARGVAGTQEQYIEDRIAHDGLPAEDVASTAMALARLSRRASARLVAITMIAPIHCAAMKPATSAGRMPAKVSVSAGASVTAGLANEVDAVNQYAAVM